MKMRGAPLLYIVIMGTMLIILVMSLRMDYFESKFLPFLVASVVFVLAGAGLARQVLVSKRRDVVAEKGEGKEAGEWRRLLVNSAWVIAFMVAIYVLGFIIAMPLFILSYMKWLGTRWRVAAVSAVVASGVVYVIFQLALGIVLYRGLLFQ